jgi:hypothetical protein
VLRPGPAGTLAGRRRDSRAWRLERPGGAVPTRVMRAKSESESGFARGGHAGRAGTACQLVPAGGSAGRGPQAAAGPSHWQVPGPHSHVRSRLIRC